MGTKTNTPTPVDVTKRNPFHILSDANCRHIAKEYEKRGLADVHSGTEIGRDLFLQWVRDVYYVEPSIETPEPPELQLYAEAFNVTNSTGLSPLQMQERLEEAVRLLRQSEAVLIQARVYVDANTDGMRGEYMTDTWDDDVARSVSNINATLEAISTLTKHP